MRLAPIAFEDENGVLINSIQSTKEKTPMADLKKQTSSVRKRTYSLGMQRGPNRVESLFVDVTIDGDVFYFEVYQFAEISIEEQKKHRKFVRRQPFYFSNEEQIETLRSRICKQLESEGL